MECCILFTYNRALELFQTETFRNKDIYTEKPSKKTGRHTLIAGWKKLKTYVMDQERIVDCGPFEQEMLRGEYKQIPYDLKTEACHEVYSRWFSTKESLVAKNKDVTAFKMNPKDKKDRIQSIYISINGGKPSVKWNEKEFTFWPNTGIGPIQVKRTREIQRLNEVMPKEGECRKRVTLKREGTHYYMIFPFIKQKTTKTRLFGEKLKVMATDPGICTFQTTFDGEKFIEYAPGGEKSNDKNKPHGSVQRLFRLGRKMDKLQSNIDQYKKDKYAHNKERKKMKKVRYKMRKQKKQIQRHIENLTRETHISIAKEWSSSYDDIMISRFNVSEMVKKEQEDGKKRKLNAETTRKMLNWSHFKFRQRLKEMAELTSCVVHEVGEHYTSMSCGKCGVLHRKLGGNRQFKCPTCDFQIKRDFNGARNIFMMNVEQCVGHVIPSDP
jgi:transposase